MCNVVSCWIYTYIGIVAIVRGVRGQRHVPAAVYPRESPDIHCTEGWVVPKAVLERCGKSRLPPGLDPRTVQPVAGSYTD
jgi:hypothetical protein